MSKEDSDLKSLSMPDDDSKYIWVTDFDEDSLRAFYSHFTRLESDDTLEFIPIIISSYGGETDVLSAMRDIIKASDKLVATIAMGKAMSSGAALLAAGSKKLRFATENTSILIHEMSSGAGGKASDVIADTKDIEISNKKFLTNLARDMGVPFETVRAELDKRRNANWYLTAKEAKKWGLIDHVCLPKVVRMHESFELLSERPLNKGKAKSKKPIV